MLEIFLQRKGKSTKVSNIKLEKLISELVESLFFYDLFNAKKIFDIHFKTEFLLSILISN
jgi:hypothetical protein